MTTAVVVGGGVVGAMAAWSLVKEGVSVTIIDREAFGSACSHGNCGFIAPSQIPPLNQPGAFQSAVASLLKRDAPVSVSAKALVQSASWFWNFQKHCNAVDMMASAVGRAALLSLSMSLYEEMISQGELDCEWRQEGLLIVHDTEEEAEGFSVLNEVMAREFGVEANRLSPDELAELEPALKQGFGGGWFHPGDAHVRSDRLMTSLKQLLLTHGVEIVEGVAIEKFRGHGSQASVAIASQGEWQADVFVVATGATTPFLNDELGTKIPIVPGKGYSITMGVPEAAPRIPLIFEESHVAITPMETGYRIGSTMEFAGYSEDIKPEKLALLRASAEKYLRDPFGDPVEEEWFGWRPMTYDGKPIIDKSPRFGNVWIAAGHNMLGMSMAPATGELLADLILGRQPSIDPEHFALSRFG